MKLFLLSSISHFCLLLQLSSIILLTNCFLNERPFYFNNHQNTHSSIHSKYFTNRLGSLQTQDAFKSWKKVAISPYFLKCGVINQSNILSDGAWFYSALKVVKDACFGHSWQRTIVNCLVQCFPFFLFTDSRISMFVLFLVPCALSIWGRFESKHQHNPSLFLSSYFGAGLLQVVALLGRETIFSSHSLWIGMTSQILALFNLFKWFDPDSDANVPSYLTVAIERWCTFARAFLISKLVMQAIIIVSWKLNPLKTIPDLFGFMFHFQVWSFNIIKTWLMKFSIFTFLKNKTVLDSCFIISHSLYWVYFFGLFLPYTFPDRIELKNSILEYAMDLFCPTGKSRPKRQNFWGHVKDWFKPMPYKPLIERIEDNFKAESLMYSKELIENAELKEFFQEQFESSRAALERDPFFHEWTPTPRDLMKIDPIPTDFGVPLPLERPYIFELLQHTSSANDQYQLTSALTNNFSKTPRVKWAAPPDFEYEYLLNTNEGDQPVNLEERLSSLDPESAERPLIVDLMQQIYRGNDPDPTTIIPHNNTEAAKMKSPMSPNVEYKISNNKTLEEEPKHSIEGLNRLSPEASNGTVGKEESKENSTENDSWISKQNKQDFMQKLHLIDESTVFLVDGDDEYEYEWKLVNESELEEGDEFEYIEDMSPEEVQRIYARLGIEGNDDEMDQ